MLRRTTWLATLLLAALATGGCSATDPDEARNTRPITLPNGDKIRVEVMMEDFDLTKGLMFRDSLPRDRGMLFFHKQPARVPYWMYQVKIPLDIIWMDRNKEIQEIIVNVPPCKSKSAKECPNYGGHYDSMYVLELNAGEVKRRNINIGDRISF